MLWDSPDNYWGWIALSNFWTTGGKDRKTAQWIQKKKNKVRDIMETISKLKWNWAGHVVRRIDYCWTTCIMFWMSWKHTRNRGRPRIKWRDDLDSFIKRCHCVTENLDQWRSKRKVYIQQWRFNGWNLKLGPEKNLIDAMKCIKTGLSVFFFINITIAIAYTY